MQDKEKIYFKGGKLVFKMDENRGELYLKEIIFGKDKYRKITEK